MKDTREIPLSQGKIAIVDADDYDWLMQWKWYYSNNGYAVRNKPVAGKRKTVLMHRLILNAPNGVPIDHADRNKLNNSKKNLRFCSSSENFQNRERQSNNTSGYKGVCQVIRNKWLATIVVNRKQINLGCFNEILDAAYAYNQAALRHFGEFAVLNELPPEYQYDPIRAKKHAPRKGTSSGIQGVVWHKQKQKWQAQIGVNGKMIFLGRYDTLEEAAEARRQADLRRLSGNM